MKNFIKSSLILLFVFFTASCAQMSKSQQIDETIDKASYPLKPVDDIDSILFIKAAAQGQNEIKYCNYSPKKNARIANTTILFKKIFVTPSRFRFNNEQINRFVDKEAVAQYKADGKRCFNSDNSKEDFDKKFDFYDESIKETIKMSQ